MESKPSPANLSSMWPDGGVMTRGTFLKGIGALGGAVALGACGSTSGGTSANAKTPKQGGTVTMALGNSFSSFNPALAIQIGSIAAVRHVFEPLVLYRQGHRPEDVSFVPWMIEAFPTQVAPQTFHATLRSGLIFQDGSPVTPADVAFSYEFMKDPKNGSLLGPLLSPIASVKTQGDKIVFKLDHDFSSFNEFLSFTYIMPEKTFHKMGAAAFAQHPVGSGPYRFAALVPNAQVTLKRFPGYVGKFRPRLDTIIFQYVQQDATREVQLRGGSIQIADQVPFRDYTGLSKTSGITAASVPSGGYPVVEFNDYNGPFADVRMRQAFMYAIDKQAIVDRVFQGQATVADSTLPPWHPYYVRPQTVYEHDPERAKALMAAAGHSSGVSFQLQVSTIPWIQEMGTLVASQLQAVGMQPSIYLHELESGYNRLIAHQTNAFLSYGVPSAFGEDPDLYFRLFYYGSSQTIWPWTGPWPKKFDKVVDEGLAGGTTAIRKAKYAEAMEILAQQVPGAVPIVHFNNDGAWSTSVGGYYPSPGFVPDLSGAYRT